MKTEAFRIETQNKAKAEADARVLTIAQERDAAGAQVKNVQEQAALTLRPDRRNPWRRIVLPLQMELGRVISP